MPDMTESHDPTAMSGRAVRRARILVCLLAALVFAPSLLVPFQYDDYPRLVGNPALAEGPLGAALAWLGNSRLLPSLTLVADYQLYGDEPAGYHLLSIALHVLAAAGVFALGLALAATPSMRHRLSPRGALAIATVAALVFACHPLQTEAVAYIIQRATVMAAACAIWAATFYIRARCRAAGTAPGSPAPLYAVSGALTLAAVLSKENAITLPLALLAAEWIFFARPPRRVWVLGGAAMAVVGVALAAFKAALWNPPPRPSGLPFAYWEKMLLSLTGYGTHSALAMPPSLLVYLMTQAVVVPQYLALLVAPCGLNVDHHVPLQTEISWAVVAGWALIAGLIGAAVATARRAPLVSFGLWWFLLGLLVESVVPLGDILVERRLYLPMAGVGLVAGVLFEALWRRLPGPALVLGGAALIALSALTVARIAVWQSPLALWLDAVDKSPTKARPWLNLGVALQWKGQLQPAVEAYCRALALQPNNELATENLELALIDLGRLDPLAGTPVVLEDGTTVYELPPAASFCPRRK
jgi:hypothetical protein